VSRNNGHAHTAIPSEGVYVMKFGVVLPNIGRLALPNIIIDLAETCEQLGFDGVFVNDHVIVPNQITSPYPYRANGIFPILPNENILDPIITLTYIAAQTTQIELGLSVLVLPYRQPILNAKMLSTLNLLCNGRLILGVGVGWMKEEFEALGADYSTRGKDTDSHIELLRSLWRDGQTHVDGVGTITMHPKPRSHTPIWTGGITRAALKRAAQYADGWHGIRINPTQLKDLKDQLFSLRKSYGHTLDRYCISLRSVMEITNTQVNGTRIPLRGTVEQIRADIEEYHQSGLDYLILEPRAESLDGITYQLTEFMTKIKPQIKI
jgi:probable F420-dependent oxidoreductase